MGPTKYINEHDLIEACLRGRSDAQKVLYDRHKGKMMALCYRYAKNKDEAEDILQDGFIRVFNKLNTFKGNGSLEGWIRTVIVNIAIRHYQKNSRIHLQTPLEHAENKYGEEVILRDIRYTELLDLVQSMPDGYRLVFNMYAIEGYSHKEISKKLGISEGTSKSQLARARGYLKKRLEIQSKILNRVVGNE